MDPVQARRNRLNVLILILPGQWLSLMVAYWGRFLPAFRPYRFGTDAPTPLLFLLGCCLSLVPFLLPRTYFVPRAFERGRLYPFLGVRWFRYVAPDGVLVNRVLRRMDPAYRVVRDRATLRAHIEGTYPNERWHLSFFIAGSLTVLHAISTGQYGWSALLVVTNVAFNLFPIFHQRYKRARARHLFSQEPDARSSLSKATRHEADEAD